MIVAEAASDSADAVLLAAVAAVAAAAAAYLQANLPASAAEAFGRLVVHRYCFVVQEAASSDSGAVVFLYFVSMH